MLTRVTPYYHEVIAICDVIARVAFIQIKAVLTYAAIFVKTIRAKHSILPVRTISPTPRRPTTVSAFETNILGANRTLPDTYYIATCTSHFTLNKGHLSKWMERKMRNGQKYWIGTRP